MPRKFEQVGPRPRHLTLPPPTAEDFAEIEDHLDAAELILRRVRVYPKTLRALEEFQQLVSGEQRRISHEQQEEAAAKAALLARQAAAILR
jgi:hypothetical protein